VEKNNPGLETFRLVDLKQPSRVGNLQAGGIKTTQCRKHPGWQN
jgi:hypothetical protein